MDWYRSIICWSVYVTAFYYYYLPVLAAAILCYYDRNFNTSFSEGGGGDPILSTFILFFGHPEVTF